MVFQNFKKLASMAVANNPELALEKYFPGTHVVSVGSEYRLEPSPCCGHEDCCNLTPGTPLAHCFSCGKGGLVVDFLLGCGNFNEAEFCRDLAEMYNLELPSNWEKSPQQAIRQIAVEFYHNQLMESTEPLRHQLQVRKHVEDTLRGYKVGFSSNFTDLERDLITKGYTKQQIKDAGVWIPDSLFVYPYIDHRTGEICRLNTKPLPDDSGVKRTMFSVGEKACYTTPKISKEMVILVEGENDLVSLVESGADSVIALGGMPSENQLQKLSKLTDDCEAVYSMFDDDQAGEKYTEMVNRLMPHKKVFQVNYDGKDPDELLKATQHPVNLEELLKTSTLLPSDGYVIRQNGRKFKILSREFCLSILLKDRSKKGDFYGDIEVISKDGTREAKLNKAVSSFNPKRIPAQYIVSLNRELENFYDGQLQDKNLDELIDAYPFSLKQDQIIRRIAEVIRQAGQIKQGVAKAAKALGTAVRDKVLQEINDFDNAELNPDEVIPKIKVAQSFSLKNDEALFYFTRVTNDDGGMIKIPFLLSSKKELIQLDLYKRKNPQKMLLVNNKYEMPLEVPTAISDIQETSLVQQWVDRYMAGDVPKDMLQPHVLIRILEREAKRFFYSPDSRVYKVIALWIFGTYAYELFSEYPYLYLNGKKGAGKSTVDNFIYAYAFNAKLTSHITEAALFRVVSAEGGTMILDELENLTSRTKSQESGMAPILKSGYSKSAGKVYRSNPDKGFATEGFIVYGPKVISNIFGLEDVIYDRCLEIQMQEAPTEVMSSLEKVDFHLNNNLSEIKQFTSHCCLSVMENFRLIYQYYTDTPLQGATARMSQIMSPLKALAAIAGPEFTEALDGYYEDRILAAKLEVDEKTPEGLIKKILTEISLERMGRKDFCYSKYHEDAFLPDNCKIIWYEDGFTINRLGLKVLMESHSPGIRYPLNRVHWYLKQAIGVDKLEVDSNSSKRTTVTLNIEYNYSLLRELGSRFQVPNYRFYFKDFVKDWKPAEVAKEPTAPTVSSASTGNHVSVFLKNTKAKTNPIVLDGEF